MPLARIRSFDPEAIAFLAAHLAESGYTLQFVRPDETGLEEADLELTVVRRDIHEALRIAEFEAEQLGADVTVVPGAIPASAPQAVPEFVPVVLETPACAYEITQQPPVLSAESQEEILPVAATRTSDPAPLVHEPRLRTYTSRLEQVARTSSEHAAHALGRGAGMTVEALEAVSVSAARGFAGTRASLAQFSASAARRLNDWKVQFRTARALRREAKAANSHAVVVMMDPRPIPRKPRPFWLRERIYKMAALAAVIATAAIIGWSFAGAGGPANPVSKDSLLRSTTVDQQVPFGPASANAPAAPLAPARVSARSVRPVKAKPAPSHTQHAAVPHAKQPAAGDDDSQEVVVRHFNRKPVAQAKAHEKEKDGVKVISEE
ncbi:MAG: hypothetical protein ACM3JB_26310 [Acidobacteriaceae bacterium]